MAPQVILYAYPESPFAQKLEILLALKQIPYSFVQVERMPPRPALHQLNITYRRIPVLAIDSDLYLDTSLAALALEERFPSSVSMKSGESWGIQNAAAFHWSDRAIFALAAGVLPWTKMPDAFVKDRSAYKGATIDPKAMEAARPKVLSALRSHLDLIEKQLASRSGAGGENKFLLGTEKPTYLDVSLYFSLAWVAGFGTADSIFKPSSGTPAFPLTFKWMSLLKSTIASSKGNKASLSPDEAAKILLSRSSSTEVKVDEEEPLLLAGWLKIGDQVEVTPNDSGKVPQLGKLVGLDREKVSIEVEGPKGGKVWVHAPRLGFDVKRVKQ